MTLRKRGTPIVFLLAMAVVMTLTASATAVSAPKTHKVGAMKLCQSFRTTHLLCGGGRANAGGTITHYSIVGKTTGHVRTTLMVSNKTTCTTMSWKVFAPAKVKYTTLRIITVNGTFKVVARGSHPKTLTANVSKKPFIMKVSQSDGWFALKSSVYLTGHAKCGSASGT